MSALNLALFGHFEASFSGEPLGGFRTLRAQALLVYLSTELVLGASYQRREHLMELLWPGMPPESARTNLRQNLYYLRQTIPSTPAPDGGKAISFLLSDRQSLVVNPQYPLEFDVQRFSDLLAGPQENWPQAIALYRGDFLSDFYLPDTNPFEEWAAARREIFRRQALDTLEGLTNMLLSQGQLKDAEGFARRQLAIDRLREPAYRQLMKVLFWSGRRAEALNLYLKCVRILQDELDLPPSEATTRLAETIREGILARRPDVGEPGAGTELALSIDKPEAASAQEQILEAHPQEEQSTLIRNNLFEFASSFIGRETELRALEDMIDDPNTRLVTIVGSGGIGKTRLATAVAAQALASGVFPDGLFFIDLVPLQERGQMLQAVADVLNFPLQEGDDGSSWQHLLEYLLQKKILFLFDSFEHLLDCAALVADILQAGPAVKVLVTSRERLHLKLEQIYPIQGLPFPEKGAQEDAAKYSAVRLFIQSARRIQPDFDLEDKDIANLTRICRMVAGMPLALELAASWIDILPLDEIASELQQGLNILETELRDVPERQRSVRASFDYSWCKLDEAEQSIFAQLSIFRGGFTRMAAEEVAGASLRQLSHLVNKSLIGVDTQHNRYSIHNLLRQYGADKLGQQPVLEAVTNDRYSDYFCRMLAAYRDDLKGPGQAQALSAINADLKNVQQAWGYASSQHNLKAIDMALESMWRFYWNFGRRDVKEFETTVAVLRTGDTTGARGILLGRLLAPLGRFYGSRGSTVKAKETLEESLELLQRLGAVEESLLPLLFLAEVQGSLEESNRIYQQGLALARKIGDSWAIGHALLYLGRNAIYLGDYQEAAGFIRDALDQFKQNGDKAGIAFTLSQSGLLAIDQGSYEDALALARESISVTQEVNPGFGWGWWVQALALFALGEYGEAEEEFQQMLTIHRERGNKYHVYGSLFWLGEVAFSSGDYSRASQRFQDSLAWALKDNDLAFIVQNQNALGRLDLVQGKVLEARKRFRVALEKAMELGQQPFILDCLADIARLLEEEGELNDSASLALVVTEHPACRAKTRDRGKRLLERMEAELSTNKKNDVRTNDYDNDLLSMVTRVLVGMETT